MIEQRDLPARGEGTMGVPVRNQRHGCQGCQAGWPVRDVFGVDMHVVIGGYIGEMIMCVKGD